jgi:hypothetical protein
VSLTGHAHVPAQVGLLEEIRYRRQGIVAEVTDTGVEVVYTDAEGGEGSVPLQVWIVPPFCTFRTVVCSHYSCTQLSMEHETFRRVVTFPGY